MRTFGNIIWHFPFFGFISAIFVYLFGALLTVTVIAAPVGLGLMELGKLLFAPFGKVMISADELDLPQNKAWKAYSTIVMVLYFPIGVILAFCAIIQTGLLFLSIIGIPVGIVVAKALGTYFNPVGKKCVSTAVAAEIEQRKAKRLLDSNMEASSIKLDQPATMAVLAEDSDASSPARGSLLIEKYGAHNIVLVLAGVLLIFAAVSFALKHHSVAKVEQVSSVLEEKPAPITTEKTPTVTTPPTIKAVIQPEASVKEASNPIIQQHQEVATVPTEHVEQAPPSEAVKQQPSKKSEAHAKKVRKPKLEKHEEVQSAAVPQPASIQPPQSTPSGEQQVAVQTSAAPQVEQSKKHHGLRGLIEKATGVDPGSASSASEHQCSDGEKAMHANGC